MIDATVCPDCTEAKARTWSLYRKGCHGCHGCTARSIARSLTAFNALSAKGTGERKPLSDMVDKLMATVPRDDAVRMVRDWYRHDRSVAA